MGESSDISALCAAWISCKRTESEANARRLEIEKQICTLAKSELPHEGSATVGDLKIVTGFTRSWDVECLTQIYKTKPTVFPFKIDWKEDRRLTSKLEASDPSAMATFAPALTIKEKKPSFTYIGE